MDLQEAEILNILKNKNELLQSNSERRRDAYTALEYTSEEITKAISLHGRLLGSQEAYSGKRPHSLAELLEVQKKKEREYQRELFLLLEALDRERERIQRVWLCYQALPLQQYNALKGLYIDKKLWNEIEDEMGLNHRLFVEIRKSAVKNIQKMYISSYTNTNIIEIKYRNREEKTKRSKKEEFPGQLSFDFGRNNE